MVKQLSLFNTPTLNVLRPLKESMADAAKDCGLSREDICDRMNDLAERFGIRLMKGNGQRLNLATLEKWLNPQDKVRVMPLKVLPVFCEVVGSTAPVSVLVEPLGFRVIGPKEVKKLAWADHSFSAKNARAQMRKLEQEL